MANYQLPLNNGQLSIATQQSPIINCHSTQSRTHTHTIAHPSTNYPPPPTRNTHHCQCRNTHHCYYQHNNTTTQQQIQSILIIVFSSKCASNVMCHLSIFPNTHMLHSSSICHRKRHSLQIFNYKQSDQHRYHSFFLSYVQGVSQHTFNHNTQNNNIGCTCRSGRPKTISKTTKTNKISTCPSNAISKW